MPLTDLYCVYNRARGIDLISPHDLLKVVESFGSLGLGIELKLFAHQSLMVVKLSSLDEKQISSEIISIFTKMGDSSSSGLDCLSCAKALNVSVDIAEALLRIAVDSGFICEDSYAYGMYYFQNLFDSFIAQSPI